MRRFLLLMIGLAAFPCIMFAQSYFGNFGANGSKTTTPAPQSTQGASIPAPIPPIASPQEFRSSIGQAGSQNRVDAQYQELLSKQPPPRTMPSVTQPTQPPPAAAPPPTSTTTVTTTTKPAAPPLPPPPTAVIQAAPTAPQVQIERAPTSTSPTTATETPTPETMDKSLLQQPSQSQVYTGFAPPPQKNGGNQPGTPETQGNNNQQGGWNIKY